MHVWQTVLTLIRIVDGWLLLAKCRKELVGCSSTPVKSIASGNHSQVLGVCFGVLH